MTCIGLVYHIYGYGEVKGSYYGFHISENDCYYTTLKVVRRKMLTNYKNWVKNGKRTHNRLYEFFDKTNDWVIEEREWGDYYTSIAQGEEIAMDYAVGDFECMLNIKRISMHDIENYTLNKIPFADKKILVKLNKAYELRGCDIPETERHTLLVY